MNQRIKIKPCFGVYPGGPETTLLAKAALRQNLSSYLDMGTGNGYIAIYLKKAGREVEGSDISQKALDCARKNAQLNNCQINFFKSDLFKEVKRKYDCITFIPPISARETESQRKIKSVLRHFPWLIKLIRPWLYSVTQASRRKLVKRFISQAKGHLLPGGRILISLPSQDLVYLKQLGLKIKSVGRGTRLTSIYQISYE